VSPPVSPPLSTGPGRSADSAEVLARVSAEMQLVGIIAGQLRRQLGPAVDHDELVSLGHEGLLSAARSFDPERGVPFRRWANIRVRGAMIDGVRSQATLPRRVYVKLRAIESGDRYAEALHEEDAAAAGRLGDAQVSAAEKADERLGVYLSGIATAMAMGLVASEGGEPDRDPRAVDGGGSAETLLARQELLAHARAAIAELPAAERRLIERHYFDDVTFEEAARELGLSKSWASRLHARGIEAITRSLRRAKVV
jgi:RNA polymerase sigma factor for flagellar operon FliA